MELYLQIGAMLYPVIVGLQSLLTSLMRKWKVHSKYPAFWSYCLWLTIGNALIFIPYYGSDPWTYAKCLWFYYLIDGVMCGGALGELFGKPRWGYVAGFIVSLSMAPGGYHVWKYAVFGFLMSGTAWLAVVFKRGNRQIALGFLVMFLFSAIVSNANAPMLVKYVPTLAWACSLAIWFREFGYGRESL